MPQQMSITGTNENKTHRKNLPSFVKKLWIIVNDSQTDHLICWTQQGDAIWIPDASTFSKAVLPRYFKHNNWQSFVRQLNLYGFRKVSEAEFPIHGPRRNPDGWQFRHDQFRRNAEGALQHVQRRRSVCRTIASGSPTSPPPSSPYGPINKRAALPASMKHEHELVDDASHGSNNDNAINDCLVRLNDMLENVQSRTTNIHHALGQLRVAQTQQQELLASVVTFATSLMANGASSSVNNEAIYRLKQKLAQHNTQVASMPALDESITQHPKHDTRSPPSAPLATAAADKNDDDNDVSLEAVCASSPSSSTLQLPPIYSRPANPLHTSDQSRHPMMENERSTKHATLPFVTLPCINTATTASTPGGSSSIILNDGSNNNNTSSSSLPTLRSLALP